MVWNSDLKGSESVFTKLEYMLTNWQIWISSPSLGHPVCTHAHVANNISRYYLFHCLLMPCVTVSTHILHFHASNSDELYLYTIHRQKLLWHERRGAIYILYICCGGDSASSGEFDIYATNKQHLSSGLGCGLGHHMVRRHLIYALMIYIYIPTNSFVRIAYSAQRYRMTIYMLYGSYQHIRGTIERLKLWWKMQILAWCCRYMPKVIPIRVL